MVLDAFRPVAMNWVITNQCPLRCVHCLNGFHKPDPTELSSAQRMQAIEILSQIGVRRLSLMGGEPFVVQDLDLLVEYARRHDIDVNITTAGISSDRTMLMRLRRGVEYFNVSIDGGPELNDQFRGKGIWAKAVHFCQLARELGIALRLYTVQSQANAGPEQRQQIVELARRLRVQTLILIHFSPIGEGQGMDSLRLPGDQWTEIIRQYQEQLEPEGIQVKKADPFEPESQKIFIDPYGRLYVPQGRFPRRYIGHLLPAPEIDFAAGLDEQRAEQHLGEYADRLARPKWDLMSKLAPAGMKFIPPSVEDGEYGSGFYVDQRPVTVEQYMAWLERERRNPALHGTRSCITTDAGEQPLRGIAPIEAAAFAQANARRLLTDGERQRICQHRLIDDFQSEFLFTAIDAIDWVVSDAKRRWLTAAV